MNFKLKQKILIFLTSILAFISFALADTSTELMSQGGFFLYPYNLSAAYIDDVRSMMLNPALLGIKGGLQFYYSHLKTSPTDELPIKWGKDMVFLSAGNCGIGWETGYSAEEKKDGSIIRRHSRIFSVGGNLVLGDFRIGNTFKWFKFDELEDQDAFGFDTGISYRLSSFLTIGAVRLNDYKPVFHQNGRRLKAASEWQVGIGFRPFTDGLTILLDDRIREHTRFYNEKYDKHFYSLRVIVEPIQGIFVDAYADEGKLFGLGLKLSLGNMQIGSGKTFSSDKTDENLNPQSSFELSLTSIKEFTTLTTKKKVSRIEIGGVLLDQKPGFSLFGAKGKGMREILDELDAIEKSLQIKGVLLEIEPIQTGFIGGIGGLLQEIRDKLLKLRQSGKKIVVYLGEGASGSEYYLASAADKIVMPPLGAIIGLSVSVEVHRIRGLLEKIGIGTEYETAGKYKSSFHSIAPSATEEQAQAIQSLVDDVFDQIFKAIVKERNLSEEAIKPYQNGDIISSREAFSAGLIDRIGDIDEAKNCLMELLGRKTKAEEVRFISTASLKYFDPSWKKPKIALIPGYGMILPGKSKQDFIFGERIMGSETVVKQLRKARLDKSIKAVIFRIDSGGGSGIASDEILKEVKKFKESKKVLVVSMGDIAGSGGYWIACSADKILASPATITGSIGAVFFKPYFEELYEKLGVENEVYKKGEHADLMSTSRPFTDEERERMRQFLNELYEIFLQRVAEGRNLPIEKVREIAQGRVYTGNQALQLGLIDQLGGLEQAIEVAKELAGIKKDVQIVTFDTSGRFRLEAGFEDIATFFSSIFK